MQDSVDLRQACRFYILGLTALGALSVIAAYGYKDITSAYLFGQDIYVLFGFIVLLPVLTTPAAVSMLTPLSRLVWQNPASSCLILTIALAGAILLAHLFFPVYGFDLSRDEVMASFDAKIMASGKLFAPLPEVWRNYTKALNPDFLFPFPGNSVWLSEYLPVNSALMAAMGHIFEPRLTQPLLAAISLLTLFATARRLFAQRPDAIAVAVIMLACSAQFLVTAQTTFAMTAHLTFNLIWLWLFLRDDRLGHFGAITVGFFATGLHQFLFHPLFAAPFILRLLWQKRRILFVIYCAAYAAIILFWMNYWNLIFEFHAVLSQQNYGAAYWLQRVRGLIDAFSPEDLSYACANLVRFITWQHVLVLPLSLLGILSTKPGYGIPRALALSFGITLLTMVIIIPYQGYGWGYRYLHGLLGNLALLAGYGWIAATDKARPLSAQRAKVLLIVCTAASALILVPLRAVQAGKMVASYRAAYETMKSANLDFVIVDDLDILNGRDLVRNDPTLGNRPLLFDMVNLEPNQIDELCARGSVGIFDQTAGNRLGLNSDEEMPEKLKRYIKTLRARLSQRNCGKAMTALP